MTPHDLRARQRLQSDEDRQAHEAIAQARRVGLEQRYMRWWIYALIVVIVVIAILLTLLAVVFGFWRGR